MIARCAAVLVTVSAIVSASTQSPPAGKPVTSATARVIRKTVDAQFVHIENRRNVPLVQSTIELRSAQGRGGLTVGRHYQGRTGTADAPIAPNELRPYRVSWHGEGLAATATVKLVLFADGSHAGSVDGLAEFRKEQEALIADLTFWQRTLQELPQTSRTAAHEYLREKVRERAVVESRDRADIRGQIEDWFGPYRSTDWPFVRAKDALRQVTERLDDATRYRAHVDDDTAPEYAVAVWVASGHASDFVAVVENLRDTPLEAFELEYSDSTTTRPRGGVMSDAPFALLDDPRPGGRNSGQVREFEIGPADDLPDAAMPKATLSFALWRDLSWEGSTDSRARLFKQRQERAEQHAFWITALTEATLQSPADVLGFLRQKRSERRREAPYEPDLMGDTLDGWAKRADAASFPAFLNSYRRTLEQQHALLTRHLSR